MKTFIRIVLMILVSVGLLFIVVTYFLVVPTCEEPIPYRIGTLDPQFGLTPETLRPILQKAEKVWEDATGMDLFVEDPKALLRVNFTFDERQIRTLESKELDARLESLTATQTELERDLGKTTAAYDAAFDLYDEERTRYEGRLRKYNKEVEYWNKRGGAPEDEYKKLKKEARALEKAGDSLEEDITRLNSYARVGGTLAEKDKALVEDYNQEVNTFQETYGESREFDKGLYTGEAITIYQFEEEADLILALAHELGHALDIGHVGDPESFMYPVLEKQDLLSPEPTEADLAAFTQACEEREYFLVRKVREVLSK